MTAHAYVVAKWPGAHRPAVVPPALIPEARETALSWAVVWAFSKAHARRLFLERAEAVRGVDGRLECCGVEP